LIRNNSAPTPSRLIGIVALALALLLGAGLGWAQAGQVTLSWDANNEPNLDGYYCYYGTVSGTYGTPIDVGNVTTYTVTGLTEGETYFFAVTAYGSPSDESGYSNEVSYTVPGIPEIALLGNATAIADGDTTPASTDHTDFGSVCIGITRDAHLHDLAAADGRPRRHPIITPT